ncbi:MAG: hypothetical protein J5637_00325 [Prevotella sp.]|nr:hypothetical protein [Prevotella sp.]
MRITAVTASPEPCTEAGWDARQYHLDGEVTRALVDALRPLGSTLLLDALRQPFFKVENHHFIIKGLLGDTSIRVACHRDHTDETRHIREAISHV